MLNRSEIFKPNTILVSDREELALKLRIGNRLYGEVKAKVSDNGYVISIRNINVLAESQKKLQPGDRIELMVKELYPKLKLQIIDGAPNKTGAEIIQTLLSQNNAVLMNKVIQNAESLLKKTKDSKCSNAVSGLIKSINSFLLHPDSGSSDIKKMLSHIAMNFARRTYRNINEGNDFGNDMRTALFKAKSFLEENPANDKEPRRALLQSIDEVLRKLTADEVFSDEEYAEIELPLFENLGIDSVRMRIKKEANPGDGYFNFHLSVFTVALGEITVLVSGRGKELNAVFYAENDKKAGFIADNAGELKKTLSKAGYSVERVNCLVSKDKLPPPQTGKIDAWV